MRLFFILLGMLGMVFGEEVKIWPGQTLKIRITGVPVSEKGRLDNTYSVSKEGKITMWKIGSIEAAGKTRAGLAKAIAEAYQEAEIYDSPVFQVAGDRDYHPLPPNYTVGGQVRQPGQRSWKKGVTLGVAVEAAGGETPYADLGRVKLYRKGKVYTLDLRREDHRATPILEYDTIEVTSRATFGR